MASDSDGSSAEGEELRHDSSNVEWWLGASGKWQMLLPKVTCT